MQSKKLLIVLVIVIIIAFGYFFFMRGGSIDTASLLSVQQPGTVSGENILAMLSRLQTIRFSESIFNDERFKRLIDNSVSLGVQPIGRTNPFATVGTDAPLPSSDDTNLSPENDSIIITPNESSSSQGTTSVIILE